MQLYAEGPSAQERTSLAWLARYGHMNPEIGPEVFTSPRTVVLYLREAFTNLDITRAESCATRCLTADG